MFIFTGIFLILWKFRELFLTVSTFIQSPLVNTDRRVKVLTLKDASNHPNEVEIRVPLNTAVQEIYEVWSRFIHLDVSDFMLVKNRVPIPRTGTVRDLKLKNRDVLYCVLVKPHPATQLIVT